MTPSSFDGQQVLSWRVEPNIDGHFKKRTDIYGNIIYYFASDTPCDAMTISVHGLVQTTDTSGIIKGLSETINSSIYLRSTPLTEPDQKMAEYVLGLQGIKPVSLEFLHDLMQKLYQDIVFDTGPTQSTTTASEAFTLKRGVCQDLTHIFISMCRVIGVPARYVSGYFLRADGIVDQEAGHAWAEVKITDLGWVGFDPTNGIAASQAHVRVACGLDYLGAAPIRGARYGGGSETMDVRIKIQEAVTPPPVARQEFKTAI